ncbi:putative aldouronate transport system permease protein [Paenibacillus sp. UNCCL117]|uniref:carbohydrate ABC transporter permease n=1 Tax=unclassified Paenibacillus TaxID=185978 RepID=UPI000887564D|nr:MULTISPECIES: carbohydrate ABC transporter permease [unclassified Paenibacillus]SDC94707.1 putative aldouronate transport system permease protein [Paenibacillus sp. cl123]SFW29874.1 putative aldouronate transport system permease protein [Paenibacillus sp. UNCCL117]
MIRTQKARGADRFSFADLIIYAFFITFCVFGFVIPLLFIVSVSFTNEDSLILDGFKLIPEKLDFTAYEYIFSNPGSLIDAYTVTALQAFAGTLLGLLFMSMCAYSLSRPNFKARKAVSFYLFFTLIFSGGLIPTYILMTQYLNLGNSFWVYIFHPWLVYAFYVIIIRTFFQGLPPSLAESAKVDGAGEIRIFFQIVLPISKPVLATVALLTLLDRWNNWFTTFLFISDMKLYTLQFLLQKILLDAQTFQAMMENAPPGIVAPKIPTESLRYAMCIVAAGPMLFVFPFFQKYFTKGLTVGAVKG